MLLTFKNISQKYSFGLLINGYFLSTDKYLECAKKFDDYPTTGDTIIREYNPTKTFRLNVNNGVCKPDENKFEYVTEAK